MIRQFNYGGVNPFPRQLSGQIRELKAVLEFGVPTVQKNHRRAVFPAWPGLGAEKSSKHSVIFRPSSFLRRGKLKCAIRRDFEVRSYPLKIQKQIAILEPFLRFLQLIWVRCSAGLKRTCHAECYSIQRLGQKSAHELI